MSRGNLAVSASISRGNLAVSASISQSSAKGILPSAPVSADGISQSQCQYQQRKSRSQCQYQQRKSRSSASISQSSAKEILPSAPVSVGGTWQLVPMLKNIVISINISRGDLGTRDVSRERAIGGYDRGELGRTNGARILLLPPRPRWRQSFGVMDERSSTGLATLVNHRLSDRAKTCKRLPLVVSLSPKTVEHALASTGRKSDVRDCGGGDLTEPLVPTCVSLTGDH
ncbi:hypothetical protein PoB_006543200 [Plakobranchus ocellatus]|uniref:Uncharacterized protein n=1 Tax=Plakobranchus ocellatus TaxID=259542 RepID=A0AAV4D404_9GAST|nr:hypothetical protein PoB_006543200 [Plakobranchus ocellatus]